MERWNNTSQAGYEEALSDSVSTPEAIMCPLFKSSPEKLKRDII